jgi:hypothetical protein
MRLIDADNALELFRAEYQNTKNLIKQGEKHLDSLAEGYTEAAYIIKYISPTVDAVPVIRCRECKFWEPYGSRGSRNGEDLLELEGGCRKRRGRHLESDFCSYGKGKEKNND